MTKNMTRKGLAFGAGLALVASGLGAAPATAAAGDLVSLSPTVGSNLGVFISDPFILESAVSTQVNPDTTAYKIDNPDQDVLLITLKDQTNNALATTVDIGGFSSTGAYTEVLSNDQSITDGQFVIDMEQAGITSLVLSDIDVISDASDGDYLSRITVQPIKSVNNVAGTDEVQTVSTLTVTDDAVYTLDLPGEAAVTYTNDSSEQNGETQSTKTLTDIVAGLEAALLAGEDTATVTADGTSLVITYPAASGDVGLATLDIDTEDPTAQTVAETTAGANQGTVDFALDEDGLFDILSGDTANALEYGAGDKSVTVTSWVESEASADYETVDATYASLPQTVTWYDPKGVVVIPRVERFNSFLNDKTNTLYATIEFNKPINLEMFDDGQWKYEVTTTGQPDFTSANYNSLPAEEDIAGLGIASVNADNFGRYAFATSETSIATGTTYTVNVHSVLAEDTTVERWFSSTGYSISEGTTTGTMVAEPQITDTTDVDFTAGSPSFATAAIRAGVKSVTYETQLQSDSPLVDDESVSVPMLAVVTNGGYMPTGSSISVQGNASAMTLAEEVRMVTGFTDSDGKFDVTVVSSAAHKDETYNVDFYVLVGGVFINEYTTGRSTTIEASYTAADATGTSLKAVNSVVAGEEVTVSLTVTDQFGEAISETAKGKQLNISLEAPDEDNLDENVAVSADGEASFTFTNYLTTGSSDLLTATLYTGSSSDKTVIDTVTVTLYNTGATGAVQVPEALSGSVTYDDFIADGEKVTAGVNVDPDQDIELTGTVVDANGVGIPAAVVIISAPGMQIQEEGSDKFYMDTHTVNANSAGVFDVNLNAHMVNTTGVDVTVTTADGTTATTVVKTYLSQDPVGDGATLSGDNLVFSVAMPENVVMNQTYAVTAKLTDKWGNPVKTSGAAVQFLGAGSFELNGVSEALDKDFDSNGEALVYLRSVKDIAGPGTIEVDLKTAVYTAWNDTNGKAEDTQLNVGEFTTDIVTTVWDETVFENAFSQVVQVLESEADIVTSQKVNVGTFKGYVALYAKGYEGQKMSAIVAGKWIVVESLDSDYERVVRFTGAGYTITTKLYIDGEQVGDAFTTLTK